ncbi:DUF1564 family protein [Leptospira adleri]|uniref:DUF1564 family protein n=1 Tax=Leptospira adleri TaxID=2023186 RepID=A0A2M9YIM9_9LEPT|nr:hypothetical protein CH380_20660 [Leptospira adleri]PJZ60583.1 hypothetical protein CH376_17815 [Leptospira adleri]
MRTSSLRSGVSSCEIRRKGHLCTLLIPMRFVDFRGLEAKLLRSSLRDLLLRFDEVLIRKKFLGKRLVYARYQEENLDLKKMNFRPFEEDWVKLGILAWGLGVSRCLLFSILLELDSEPMNHRNTKSTGVPTNLSITRKLIFLKKEIHSQIRKSRAHPS